MAKPVPAPAQYLPAVRDQYEHYPYPPRDPDDEKRTLNYARPGALDAMNYYHYAGRRDFSKGLSVLVAGGGTGDAAIMMAEQLKYTDSTVTYLDISEASMQVAMARAQVRRLTNIKWVHGSILDIPSLFPDSFDYIDCMGVLHHMESPAAGLAALSTVLNDDGVIGLMLYARYGREPIYQVQTLMRMLNRGITDMGRKIANCRTLMHLLPQHHGLRQAQAQNLFTDTDLGDAGIYDLLLHSNDVAYTVPEVYALTATCNLIPTHFFFNQEVLGNDLYTLESYLGDAMSDLVAGMSATEKHAAAELMHGKITRHTFYAARNLPSVPALGDRDLVPFLSMVMGSGNYAAMYDIVKRCEVGKEIEFDVGGMKARLVKTPHAEAILKHFDGKKTTTELLEAARASCPAGNQPDLKTLEQEFAAIYTALRRQDWIYLRHKSVPAVRNIEDIQNRMGT